MQQTLLRRTPDRSGEVVALEQDRFAGLLGERVGEAVAEVQAGRMHPLAEPQICGFGDSDLAGGDRLDLKAKLVEQLMETSEHPSCGAAAGATHHDDRPLEHRGR
jgi:hypothetical protein